MPSITARPHPMLMARNDPLAFFERTVWATTPTPNVIRRNVPRNSAAASRAVPLSMRAILFLCELQHNDVLPGECFDDLVDHEPFGLEFLLHFGDAHLVDFEDRDLGIFLAEFQQHQPSARFEGAAQP